jgi:SulP family sulfate permease
LKDSGIALHFSEIKGPVMDKLNTTHFLKHLPGQVFLTNYQAIQALTPDIIQAH